MNKRTRQTKKSAAPLAIIVLGAWIGSLSGCSSPPAVFDPNRSTLSNEDEARLAPLSDLNAQANTLFQMGMDHFVKNDYPRAEFYFKKVILDFPASTYYVRAKYFLGLSYLKLNQNQQAEKFLRDYVENTAPVSEGRVGRVALARAELLNGKPHEALLNLDEAFGAQANDLPLEKSLEALIIRSRSYLALNQEQDARLASDAFISLYEKTKSDINSLISNDIKAEGYQHQIRMKNLECAKLASQNQLDESSAMDQYKRKRLCVTEALQTYLLSTQFESDQWQKDLAATMIQGIDELYHRAVDPPGPLPERSPTDRTRRSQKEIEVYRVELRHLFLRDFGQFRRESMEALQKRAKSLPLLQQKGLYQVHETLRRHTS